jgi:hypothetical protein
MILNNLITHSSSKFHYDSKTKEFVTEYSNLAVREFMCRIWDDAYGTGFVMKSAKTGKELLFLFCTADRSGENEIEGWHFCSINGKFTALIIND